MTTESSGGSGETLVFTCAGAAYSGQVANRSGVQLMEQGVANLLCIAGIAARIDEKLERTRKAARRVGIDGCSDHCVRKVLEQAGLGPEVHIVLTDLGIEKQPARPNMITDARKVVDAVKGELGRSASAEDSCCG